MKPSLKVNEEGELSLSGEALGKLLQAVLNSGASFRFRAKGYSMSPFIKDEDIITISPLLSKIRPGQIVAFLHPETGKLVVHRVIKKKGDFYLIKGDRGLDIDGEIPRGDILGTVTDVEREGKKVSLGLGSGRSLIAFFSSKRLLHLILFPVKKIVNLFKFKKTDHG